MGAWRAAALASQFGFAVVGCLVGGVIGGQFLDRWLGTSPALFLTGLVVGLVSSIYLIYVIYRVQVLAPARRGRPAGGRAAAGPPASKRKRAGQDTAGQVTAGQQRAGQERAGQAEDGDPR